MRRPYTERTCLVVKDLKDQPECKYIALVEGVGEKSGIACDAFVEGPNTITLLRLLNVTAPGPKAPNAEPVAVFSSRMHWTMVLRSVWLAMTGGEWDEMVLKDDKEKVEQYKKLYGSDKVAMVAVLENGQRIQLPATEEAKAVAEKALPKAGEKDYKYDDKALYA